jgi:hypothetical protein
MKSRAMLGSARPGCRDPAPALEMDRPTCVVLHLTQAAVVMGLATSLRP